MAVNASRATGYKITAGDWNDLAALANTVESAVNNVTTGNTALGSRVTTLESRTTGLGTDSNTTTGTASAQLTAVRSRLTTLETVTTGLGSGTNVTTGTAGAQLGDLRSRASALEAITSNASTGNSALGTRVTTLEAGTSAPPTCILLRTTNFALTGGTDTVLPFDSAEQNDSVSGNPMWSAGSPTIITIRQAGVYDIGAVVHSCSTGGGANNGVVGSTFTLSVTKNSTAQTTTSTQVYAQKKIESEFYGGNILVVNARRRFAVGDTLRVVTYALIGHTMLYNDFSGPGLFWATYVRS